jgi:hypothetical protein
MCVVGCAPACPVSPAADVASGRSGHCAVLASGRQAHRRWLGRHALRAAADVCVRHLTDAWVDAIDGSVSFHDVENGEACARCVCCVRNNSPLLSCVTALEPVRRLFRRCAQVCARRRLHTSAVCSLNWQTHATAAPVQVRCLLRHCRWPPSLPACAALRLQRVPACSQATRVAASLRKEASTHSAFCCHAAQCCAACARLY